MVKPAWAPTPNRLTLGLKIMTLCHTVELHHLMVRPRFKPAWFIMKPLARKVLFGREACDVAVGDDARGVVQTAPTSNRHPDTHDHALGLGH